MKLKSFGCSFIFGSDLADVNSNEFYYMGSKLTWPALLAQRLGYEYETHSRPGAGNLQILERFLNGICENDPALYVISWTWIDRYDYVDDDPSVIFPGTKWKTLMPVDESSIAENYYKTLHSEYRDKMCSLIYMKTAIDALREKKCKFIMTYMDDLIFCNRWNCSTALLKMMENVRPFVKNFGDKNFLEWSKTNGYEISPAMHPLEEAHRSAADLIHRDLDQWIKS